MQSERKTNMNPITRTLNVDNLLLLALQEDISSEDVTTNAVMPKACQGTVQLLCKQDGVIAGMEVFARVFTLLDEQTEMIPYVKDGDEVKKGDLLATVNGDIRVLLSGERTALNYLQRMSGIATYTRSVAKLLEGSKTTPVSYTHLDVYKRQIFSRFFPMVPERVLLKILKYLNISSSSRERNASFNFVLIFFSAST